MDATRWFHIIGLISAGTLGVGFITGVISVLLSWKINREQEAKMGQLSLTIGVLEKTAVDAKTAQQKVELELAKQQERTAKAELAVQQLRKRQEPRRLDHRRFAESLKGKSTGKAQLFYQPEDGEAFLVAFELHGALSSLGWQVTLPMPIPPDLTGEGTRGA